MLDIKQAQAVHKMYTNTVLGHPERRYLDTLVLHVRILNNHRIEGEGSTQGRFETYIYLISFGY